MTEVFSSRFQEEVIVLKTLLESGGVASEILAGSQTDLAPFWSIDVGGFRLLVADADAEDARELIASTHKGIVANDSPGRGPGGATGAGSGSAGKGGPGEAGVGGETA